MKRFTTLTLLITSSLFAGTIQYNWNTSSSDIQIDTYAEWDIISIDEGMPVYANGYPNLPAIPRCYVIPQEMTVTSVEVTNISTISLGKTLLPVPVMLLPLSGDIPEFPNYTEVNLENMSTSFPASPIAGFKTGTKTGFRIGSYSFVPFTYNQQTGELFLITSADINLVYQCDSEAPVYHLTERQVELAKRGISTFVDNPEMLETWSPAQRVETDDDVEVIVVGYNEHSNQLGDIIAFHNTMGYSSDSITVQWLLANGEGFDAQEKIRNHIKNLYENNGLLFAVLVGDSGATTRFSQIDINGMPEPMNATADLYYSDLDGTWDANGNHQYGEEFDDIDYYSDVYVGRYPTEITETDELNAMVEKTLQYNTAPAPGDWQRQALLMGAVMFPTQPEGDWRFGSKTCDSLASFFPGDWNWDKVYEDTTGYHPNNQLELFNQGTAITAYVAHGCGSYFAWYYPYPQCPPIMSCDTIQYMTNGPKLPWVIGTQSCATGSLFESGFAEMFVEHQGGGAIIATASSETTFGGFTEPGPGGWLGIYFAHMLFDQGLVTAGVTHGISKDMFWANWNSFYWPLMAEWSLQALNLYGDPCTVFVGAPEGVEGGAPQQLNTQISPNPVWHTMSVGVTLAQPAPVKVIVYDMLGRVALSRDEEILGAGEQSFGMDVSSFPAGIYMVNVVAGDQSNTLKCVVLRQIQYGIVNRNKK